MNKFLFICVLLAIGCMLTTAYAQENGENVGSTPNLTNPEASTSTVAVPGKDAMEKVEVTGSHIRRVDTEGVSPVQTINRKQLEATGANSIGDVLRDISANTFGSTRETSGSGAPGNAEVSLRGLGSDKTLVLLDGQRLPSDAVTGAVDLNLIPLAAVERVEILKDGASAIYGSDALGGVVNIITRKDFTGTELSASLWQPKLKGGGRQEASAVNGVSGEGWNVVNILQYRNNFATYSRDRSYTQGIYSQTGNPGSYQGNDGLLHPDPNCPAGLLRTNGAGTYCAFDTSNYSTQLPAIEQFGLMSQGNYEVSSNLKLTARVNATQRQVRWSFAPGPGTGLVIPGSKVGGLGLPDTTPGTDLPILYRTTELGTRDQLFTSNSGNLMLGATLQLPAAWQLDVFATENDVWGKNEGVSGYSLTSALQNDINNGNYNPFANGNKGSIADAQYKPEENTLARLFTTEAKASGEIGKINGDSIGAAVGVLYTSQRFEDDQDGQTVAGNVYGSPVSLSNSGTRSTNAGYAEFDLPLFKRFELQLAVRTDRYSDFGSSTNPKVGFLYHATDKVLFRGSWGTGFKAPNMQDLYSGASSGFPTFIDHVMCQKERQAGGPTPECSPEQYQVTSLGNPALNAEKANSYNLGVVVDATDNLNFGVDAFYTNLSNVVGIDYEQLTIAEQNGTDPSKYGITVVRDPTTGYIQSITAPLQNLSKQEVSGLDVTASYTRGKVKFFTDHSLLFFFKEEGFPGAGYKNFLQTNGFPQWRNTSGATYAISNHQTLTLDAMTIAGQQKADPTMGKISNYTEFDLTYDHKLGKKESFSLAIKNLLGTTPPLDDSSPENQLNTSLYDQIGPQFFVAYKVGF